VASAVARLQGAGLPGQVVIDASHDNSGKDHSRQPVVVEDLAAQIAGGSDAIVGVMLESFIAAGRQELGTAELVYGQSITDACMAWDDTLLALDRLAGAVQSRRAD